MLSPILLILTSLPAPSAPGVEALPCANSKSAWSYLYNDVDGSADLFGIASAPDGGVVLAGGFSGTLDFDRTEGVDERFGPWGYHAFATKVNDDGSYAWTYTAGVPHLDTVASGVGVAPDGGVIAAGTFQGTVDFDPTDAVDEHGHSGDYAAFVTKLGPDGAYLWTLSFGGTGWVGINDLALDPDGNILLIGYVDGTIDFDPGPDVWMEEAPADVFVSKLGPGGLHQWTYTFGNSQLYDNGEDIAVDHQGNVYLTGMFRGTVDFDPGPGVDQHTAVGWVENLFITKYDADGSYGWTRTYDMDAFDIAATLDGGCITTGFFEDSLDFDPGEGVDLRTSVGGGDIFVTKLDSSGSYAWTYTVGGPGGEGGFGLGVDGLADIFVAGLFDETVDFDPGPGVDAHTANPNPLYTTFVAKLRPDGSYAWTRVLGEGHAKSSGEAIAAGPQGELFVGGAMIAGEPGGDLNPGCELDLHASYLPASLDAFVAKLVCPELLADFDGNGVVDLRDVAQFQLCFTDEGPTTCDDGCPRLDLDPDDDIDLSDFLDFKAALTGPHLLECRTTESAATH
jgi:hypothetical protein